MTDAERVLTFLAVSGAWHTLDQVAGTLTLPRRAVEEAVQELRLAGNPIATGQRGVRLARTAEELAESNRSLHHRLKVQYATLRAQRKAEWALRRAEAGHQRPQWPSWDVAS
jgi:biotin operon repressor